MSSRIAVAIGSNLGDRASHIEFACDRLEGLLTGLRVSSVIETEPVEVPGSQSRYLNAAAVGKTDLAPRDLLGALLAIEGDRRRERPFHRAPRTLDLDLILFGNQVIDEADFQVPHPRFRERAFVLGPLAEIAPDLQDPITGKTVGELLADLKIPMPAGGAPRP